MCDVFKPVVSGAGVRPKGFHVTFAIVVKQGAVESQGAGIWRINERGGIAGTHLEEHAHGEFAESFSSQETADVVECVAGHNDVDAVAWTLRDEALKDDRRVWSGIVAAA